MTEFLAAYFPSAASLLRAIEAAALAIVSTDRSHALRLAVLASEMRRGAAQ